MTCSYYDLKRFQTWCTSNHRCTIPILPNKILIRVESAKNWVGPIFLVFNWLPLVLNYSLYLNTTQLHLITSHQHSFGKLLYFADRNYNAQQIYIITCKYCKLILAAAADAAADAADADCFTITRPERFTSLRSLLRSSL